MRAQSPVAKELVLIGGGHSHVAVLKQFGMEPMPGVRVTLVSKGWRTPYSGMLPGFIAGHYQMEETHIDLHPLAQFAGAQFVVDKVTGIDLERRHVLLTDRPPVRFDVLSINIGSTPRDEGVPGAREYALPVKPVERLLSGWESLQREVMEEPRERRRIVVVGGGAGGVELTLSIRHRLRQVSGAGSGSAGGLEFCLVTAGKEVLESHNRGVRRRFARILRERGIEVHSGQRVVKVTAERLITDGGEEIPYDRLIWVTNASAPDWIRASGLKTDSEGFVSVDAALRSVSHSFVFAAGDVAAVLEHPRPKSGVFAVRQGPVLSGNLRRVLSDQSPVSFRPQRQFLSLISTGDANAVASRGPISFEGRWVWRWKDWIDRRWMRRYQELPEMGEERFPEAAPDGHSELARVMRLGSMRCGGCGSKVGSGVLRRVLSRLEVKTDERVVTGLEFPDDAAATVSEPGALNVHSVDFFRSCVSDPFVFGKIAAEHCLGDLYAMGAEPRSALALATVRLGVASVMEEELFQVMSGALEVLKDHGVVLAGGHSAEGPEAVFGLAVLGSVRREALLRKGGMAVGEQLILTKPLGTGALLAAHMRGRAKGEWVQGAVASMLRSNREALRVAREHGVTACTDVTGFGLLGHLHEMCRASQTGAVVRLEAVPLLEGAREVMAGGVFSSLHAENLRVEDSVEVDGAVRERVEFGALFDPQTSGGLLLSVPADRAEKCCRALREAGLESAAGIGRVTGMKGAGKLIRVVK